MRINIPSVFGFIVICCGVCFAFGQENGIRRVLDENKGAVRLPTIRTTGNGLLDLLTLREVRSELRVDNEQSIELDSQLDEIRDSTAELFSGIQLNRDESTRKKWAEQFKKSLEKQEKFRRKLDEILDPIQMDRLLGLYLQRDGIRALNDVQIASRLMITGNQKIEMAKIAASQSLKTMATSSSAVRTEYEEKITRILSVDQKKTLDELKGAKFEFKDSRFVP